MTPLPKWFNSLPSCDWAIQVLCTSKGKMYYSREIMAVYKKHSGGATDYKRGSQKELDAFLTGGIDLCRTFDKAFYYRYSKIIKKNLINYMYPNLVEIYLYRGENKLARKYASLILNEIFVGSFPQINRFVKYVLLFCRK